MNKNKLTENILSSIYNYYTNEKNYLNESICEDDYSVVMDDNLFNDVMDMVQTGTVQETESGHYLIPTKDGNTFHFILNGDSYMDDERGNEYDVILDEKQKNELLQTLMPNYSMVMENNNNPFTNVETEPNGIFSRFTLKDGVPMEDGLNAVHTAVEKARQRRDQHIKDAEAEEEYNDRYNDPEYREKARNYWQNRYDNMAEPHGFGTSGTLSMGLEEMEAKGDIAHFEAIGHGDATLEEDDNQEITNNSDLDMKQMNESKMEALVKRITRNVLNESFGLDPEAGEDRYQEEQDYFNNPENEGKPMDGNGENDLPFEENEMDELLSQYDNKEGGDEEFYDDFLSNPTEESFPEEENPAHMDETDTLWESKENEELVEKQNKLLSFITENWNHHANNLIK